MATEATILKRDVYWDVSVGGSTVQIRVLGSSDKTSPLELVKQALERLSRNEVGSETTYSNNALNKPLPIQNYKP
jgi:hypothetical protein